MLKKLVLDTNVFYDLASGTASLTSFSSPGDVLCYSPISVFELAGKWPSDNFSDRESAAKRFLDRKGAAMAILNSRAEELPDQDSFLTQTIFGYGLKHPRISLKDAVIAMATSPNMSSLKSGVEDSIQRVIRKVSVDKVSHWRAIVEGKWVADMISLQRSEIPGFENWYRQSAEGRTNYVPRLKGVKRELFVRKVAQPNWNVSLIIACHERALRGARKNQPVVPASVARDTIAKAMSALSCYCGVYTRYVVSLLTGGSLPNRNDSGDIELFLHAVDDDHVVVTSDRKWKRLAEAAGFTGRVRIAH